jgi:hypothetical protein
VQVTVLLPVHARQPRQEEGRDTQGEFQDLSSSRNLEDIFIADGTPEMVIESRASGPVLGR